MALDKKSGFGFDMEERLRNKSTPPIHESTAPKESRKNNSAGTPNGHTQEPAARERKDRRVQLLTYGDLVDRMDAYAKRRGVSRAEVFEAAVTAFLDEVDS